MREWLQGRVGRLLLATLLLSAAVALTGACGGGSDEPSPTAAAVEAPASTPIAMPATSVSTVAPTPTPTTCTYFYAYAGTHAHTRSHPDACSYTNSDAHAYSDTPTPTPTAEPTPDPTVSSGDEILDLDENSTWQDVYDTLSSSEQSCIRDAIDEDALESLLELNILKAVSGGGAGGDRGNHLSGAGEGFHYIHLRRHCQHGRRQARRRRNALGSW